MSTTNPLFRGYPPPSWQDPSAPGRSGLASPGSPATSAPSAASPASPGSRDWFAQSPASARVLSVQTPPQSSADVDAWAQQLVNHLLNPAG